MRNRILMSWTAITLAVILSWSPVSMAQTPSRAKTVDKTAVDPEAAIVAAEDAAKAEDTASAKNWTQPRTAWGDPDLQGYWLTATYTPLQRPTALAGKAFYTEEEALEAFKKAVEVDASVNPSTVHYDWKEYAMDGWQSPVRPNRRTSLIVDPPDGKLPARVAAARKRDLARPARSFDNVETLNLDERCLFITAVGGWNNAPPMVPKASP